MSLRSLIIDTMDRINIRDNKNLSFTLDDELWKIYGFAAAAAAAAACLILWAQDVTRYGWLVCCSVINAFGLWREEAGSVS